MINNLSNGLGEGRFYGKIIVYPGEDEMFALAQGGLRVLRRRSSTRI